MDSVTQAVLGASIAGACAPQGHRRKALVVGAFLGTLPDLDVLIDFGDAVKNYTYHRGFSHSLFVLVPLATVLWLGLRRWWSPVRAAPGRWFAAILLALVTHPLLDAHTAYGTQLWWPLSTPPTMWSTLFIIDPVVTIPLLVGAVAAFIKPAARGSALALVAGLAISTAYIGWSWVAKTTVEQNARQALAGSAIPDAPVFSVPTPFNTLLWRIVVMTEDGYLEGFDSLVAEDGPVRFERYSSDTESLSAAADIPAVKRLRWFSRDFLKSTVREDDMLVLSDLRMGQEPYYVFAHEVARRGNPHWHPTATRRVETSFESSALAGVWHRIWNDQAPPSCRQHCD
jgi:inner membrane protein